MAAAQDERQAVGILDDHGLRRQELGVNLSHEFHHPVADPGQRLRVLVRTHLATLLEGDCHSPMLLGETRRLDAAARAEIAAAFDRYQIPWQVTLDELASAGRLATAPPLLRLLLLGMLNWTPQWYRPGGPLSLDQLADSVLALLLGAPPNQPSPVS